MSFSANTSSSRLVRSAQREQRLIGEQAQPHVLLARAAWQFLVLGMLAFAALRLFSGAATSVSDGRLWLILAPVASLLALHRHQLAARWARPAASAPARRSMAAVRAAQSRVPRRVVSRLRRAA